ncbi:MAG: Fe-S cluster assembly protein SufD [Acidimicrobiia bacterium]|nr:Fe-S cluster assembly protein SufD [Acidimicrobiia bacterium]
MTNAFTADASRSLGGPDWLEARRAAAFEKLDGLEWPTSADEVWRYSRIDSFDPERYRPTPYEELGPPGDEKAPGGGPVAAEAGERAGLVVVRDGRVVHHELDEQLESKGVRVCELATCGEAEVADVLGSVADASPDAFTILHDAFLAGGAFIRVPAGVVVERPIVVVHWSDGDGLASFPHTVVVADEGSEVTVLDRFSSPDTDHLVDAVVELLIGDGATAKYLSIQDHGPRTWHVGLQRAHLGRDASLSSSAVALGGDYSRLRSEAFLGGEGANSDQLAVYFGAGDQMLDFRTLQDHAAARTTSNLLFKGAVEDNARSVYSGLVHLRQSAKKAVAHQTNRNLVLTDGAGAESIPNLEIEADEVQCTHASAVGPIDEDQLYYLESRGVAPADAERLIVLGFFDDVFDRLPVPSLVSTLRRSVDEKVGHLDA